MSVPMGQYPMAGDGNNGADPVMLFPNGGTVFVSPPPTYLVTANRIFVGGFPHDTTESELKKHFEQFFTVKEVKIIRKPTGESKGFGFVTFESEEQANYVTDKEVIKADPSRLQFRNRTLNIGPAIRKVETNTVGSSYMLVSSSGDICGTTQNPQLWQYGYPVMSPGIPCYPPKPADDSIKSPRFDPGKTPVTQQQFTFPPNGSYASIVSKGNQTPNGLKDTTNGNYTHKAPETPKQTVIPPTTNNYFLGQPDQYPPPSSPFAQKKPSGQNEVVPTNKNNKENVDVNGTPANENGPVYQQPMQPAHLPPHGYQQQAPVMFMPHMQQPMNGQQYPPMNYPQMQIPVPYYYGPKSYYHPGAPYQPMPFYLQPDPYRQNYGMAAYAGTDVHIDRSFQQQKNNARGDSNNNNNRYDRNRNNSNRSTPRNYTLEKQKSPSQISTPTRERKPLEPLKLSNEGPKGGSFNSSSATATEGFKKMSDSKGFSTDTQDENVIVEKLENVKIEENL